MAKKIQLKIEELGIDCEVDVAKLQNARSNDRRGYATFQCS